ncbi:MAG: hypothetical protein DRP51_10205 [Candidatus Zixiibacteriota bacterium]|nr:MAG: hypothetical protein DRP51_10205 [candidate division Zixibacteria bacterium]
MYVPKHFKLTELVPKAIYQKYKIRGDAWLMRVLFDERLLRVIDTIRESFGPMVINDWAWNGKNQWRGFRSPQCGVGATLSQHRFGRAVDMIPREVHPDIIRDDILEDQMGCAYRDIGGLEMNISWLHIDVRGRDQNGKIMLFNFT